MAADYSDANGHESTWPWASILLLGTFGRNSAGARRYHRRALLALGGFLLLFPLLFAVAAVAGPPADPALRWLFPAAAAAIFAFIAREMWRYVSGLDEMARQLQLEAMSITYLVGLPVFVAAHFAAGAAAWSWHLPALAYVGLDVVRALVLALLTRKYS
jgi:hypothetical protein